MKIDIMDEQGGCVDSVDTISFMSLQQAVEIQY